MIAIQQQAQEALQVRSSLMESNRNLALALEADKLAAQATRTAKQNYDDAATELTAEAMLFADGKNSEARKAQVDVALVRARQPSGSLYTLWQRHLIAQNAADDARMALEQAKALFSATKYATEITTGVLNALAAER